MAEGLGQAKEGIEGEITCPLCLGIYEDPKLLPCGHIYCKSPCLVGLARQANNTAITCPECRGVAQIQNGDVDALPTAFHVNRLKDLHRTMKYSVTSTPTTCLTHKHQELAIFCETCENILCRDCVTDYHKEHQYDLIQNVAKKHRKALLEMLEPRLTQHRSLSQAIVKFDKTKSEISRKQYLLSREIDTAIDGAVQKLKEQRRRLHTKLTSSTTHKLSVLLTRRQQLTRTHSEFNKNISAIKNATEHLTDTDFVFKMSELKAQLEQVAKKAQNISLSLPAFTDEHLHTAPQDTLTVVSNQFHLSSGILADPSKCTFGKEGIQSVQVGREISVFVEVHDSVGVDCFYEQNVLIEILYLRDLSMSTLSAVRLESGRYQVKFTPSTRGRHRIGIKVNGKHIMGSPMNMFVKIPPQELDVPVATITHVEHPCGLACSGEMVLVCERKRNQIIGIDSNFRKACVIGKDLESPIELTTDLDSNIYVTTADHQIHKLDKNGRHLKVFGSHGSGVNQFQHPTGVCVSKSNKLYVCDSMNDKIKVFDLELKRLQTFGKVGSKLGQFCMPTDVKVYNNTTYIADYVNHRIQVLTPDGKPIAAFGSEGDEPGELRKPCSIHVVDDFIFIADQSNFRVSVFTTDGDLVTTFGESYLFRPEGITIDHDGFVYVSSHEYRIVVF